VRWRCSGLVGLLGLLLAAALPAESGIELTHLNGSYADLGVGLAPIREGPLAIRLSSPNLELTLHRNRLVLNSSEGGDPDARVEAEFEGSGDLVAQVEGGTIATRFRDPVVVPRQAVELRGKARVTRDPDGYTLHVVEAPPSVPVRIRSGAVRRCVTVCKGLGLLAVVDCGRLERSLSTLQVPIRSDQAALFLPSARLGASDRAYLDRFVSP